MTEPFIKCPGGKRQLANQVIARMPRVVRYVEPFVGGGAVFFRMTAAAELVLLGDADEHLIELYKAVRRDPGALWAAAKKIISRIVTNEAYLRERAAWNKGRRTSLRHLALRYSCFNGLWRMSHAGKMNTPWAKVPGGRLPPLQRFVDASQALKDCALVARDFRAYGVAQWRAAPLMREGTVVYVDPPYLGGFTQYCAEGFDDGDQLDLVRACADWSRRGAAVIYSQANVPLARALLAEHWPEAHLDWVGATRPINCDPSGRGVAPELLASCIP